jgi:hypothetical protein
MLGCPTLGRPPPAAISLGSKADAALPRLTVAGRHEPESWNPARGRVPLAGWMTPLDGVAPGQRPTVASLLTASLSFAASCSTSQIAAGQDPAWLMTMNR